MNIRFIVAVIGVIIIVMAVSAAFAGSHQKAAPGRIGIAASFYPLAEFARQVGGDRVEVSNLTPPGTEPHDFEPSPQDIVKIRQSQVFIYTGAGFEPWAERIAADLNDITVINASDGIALLPALPEQSAQTPGDNQSDPHFYLDPVTDQAIVQTIADRLSQIDPANQSYYQENARRYNAELAALDSSYRAGLSDCQRQEIITSHAAFAYLAKRYGLIQVPIAGLSDEDPSPARLGEIARIAQDGGIRYIFFEKLVSPRLSETIAAEVGAQTLVLNPAEGLTSEEQAAGKDFISLMEDNLSNLRLALECP